MQIMDVITLAEKLHDQEELFLLDVREENEWQTCQIDTNVLIPMGQIPERLGEIPNDKPVVVYCHHGGRSARVAQYLMQNGYQDVHNLQGGVDAWAVMVDPTMTRY